MGFENFFIDLPEGKTKGFCEPPQGDLHNSVVVYIAKDCSNCGFRECHMFEPIVENGKIVARKYKNHPPEY